MLDHMRVHIDGGSPPETVAAAVAKALTATNPKTRYAVGRGARLMTFLARLLPDWAKDRMLRRVFGLDATGN